MSFQINLEVGWKLENVKKAPEMLEIHFSKIR